MLSDRLRKSREQAGLEQTQLAEITRFSRATISAAENGHRRPSRATIAIWAMATGVSRDWLTNGTEPDAATLAEAREKLTSLRMSALASVISTSRMPSAAGFDEIDGVMDAISRRERKVMQSGGWEASSAVDQPELLAWCDHYRPQLAASIRDAMDAVDQLSLDLEPDPSH
jgi:transcriptional regulator with XRE-family HTH domain